MEEKSPTMLGVVFLKYLKITGVGTDSQGKFADAVCEVIPQKLGLPQLSLHRMEQPMRWEQLPL